MFVQAKIVLVDQDLRLDLAPYRLKVQVLENDLKMQIVLKLLACSGHSVPLADSLAFGLLGP